MRNMLQLLGGVAVAGAVAAGSTAFTAAAGLGNSVSGTNTFVGGSVHHTVTGATLTAISFTADTNQIPTRISAFQLTFTGAPDNATVTATDSNAVPGASATGWVCTAVASNSSTCTAKDGSSNTAYYTGVSDLTIKVV